MTATAIRATASVYLTAFRVLPPQAREQVLKGLLQDKELYEDLIDLAVAKKRMREPARPLRTFLSSIKAKNAR